MPNPPENCPICGSKMERGYIAWSWTSGLCWSKERIKSRFGWATLRGKEVIISRPYTFSGIHDAEAYRCQNCKIVLFSYGEEKEEE